MLPDTLILTEQDHAILYGRFGEFGAEDIAHGDNIDYRAMLAREVFKEREWRVRSRAVTPADVQVFDNAKARSPGFFMSLREYIECAHGEPLA